MSHRQSTHNTSAILAALGVRGGEQFMLDDEQPLVPTIQVADFSRTMAAESIEARCVISITMVGNFLNYPVFEMVVRAPGGAVIEDMRLSYPVRTGVVKNANFEEGAWVMSRHTPGDPLGSSVRLGIDYTLGGEVLSTINVGGIPCSTVFNWGHRSGFLLTPTMPLRPDYTLQPGQRWWFPAGTQVVFQLNAINSPAPIVQPVWQLTATIREIPVSPGVR